jgi:hypothetical protein
MIIIKIIKKLFGGPERNVDIWMIRWYTIPWIIAQLSAGFLAHLIIRSVRPTIIAFYIISGVLLILWIWRVGRFTRFTFMTKNVNKPKPKHQ